MADTTQKPRDVIEIVDAYLEANGYDGLVHDSFECACEKGNLAPCSEIENSCQPGYKIPCPGETCQVDFNKGKGCGDWHMSIEKPTTPYQEPNPKQGGDAIKS